MDAGVEDEEEEENKALTEELVASLRDTVRGEVFFVCGLLHRRRFFHVFWILFSLSPVF